VVDGVVGVDDDHHAARRQLIESSMSCPVFRGAGVGGGGSLDSDILPSVVLVFYNIASSGVRLEMVIALFGGSYRPGADLDELNRITTGLLPSLEDIPGFISYNFYTADDGEDLAVVRFDSRDAIEAWRKDPTHRAIWHRMTEFYSEFWVQSADAYRELLWADGERQVFEGSHTEEQRMIDLFRSMTDRYGLGTEHYELKRGA
jgi:heme-degrading monooxygenase HmoA